MITNKETNKYPNYNDEKLWARYEAFQKDYLAALGAGHSLLMDARKYYEQMQRITDELRRRNGSE